MLNFVIESIDNDTDRRLVERLYLEYMPFMKKRAYKYTQDLDICADIAHDCMIKIIRNLDSIRNLPEEKIPCYFSVAINHTIFNYSKKASRELTSNINDLSDDYDLSADISIEDEIERKYEHTLVRAAFEELPERDKSLIIMKYDLALSDKHISELTSLKQDSVRMTVLRSVRRLRKIVRKMEGYENE